MNRKIITVLIILSYCIEAVGGDCLHLATPAGKGSLRPMAAEVSDSESLNKEIFYVESFLPEAERKLWQDILEDCLRKTGKLDKTGKLKDLDALLSIDKKYFRTNAELIPVFRFYLNIAGRNHIRKPHKIPWHHTILKDIRLVTDELWDKYLKHIQKRPFPSDKQRIKWQARIGQGLKSKDMLDENGKIKNLKTLLRVGISFFNRTEVEGVKLRPIYVLYGEAHRKGWIEKSEKITISMYIMKDLGFVTDELWAEYEEHIVKEAKSLYAEKLDEEKEEFQKKVRGALKEKDMLGEDGKIRDLKTLLTIEEDFFEADKDLRKIYRVYETAVSIKRVEKEEKALLRHFILKDLGFVSDQLWAEYIIYTSKRPFPSIRQREKWQEMVEKVLKDKGLLNEDGKIEDLTTLLGIESELFEGLKGDKDKIQNSIYVAYARAVGKGRIDIPEESTIYHFILNDLGFISDELWDEYIMHGIEERPRLGQYRKKRMPAKERKKEWKASLSKALKEQGKLNNDGMIESLDTLLSIEIEFFEYDEELNAILVSYRRLALRHRISPPGAFWHHTILRGLGFVSDRLWQDYIEYLKSAPFPSDEQREDWEAKLKQALGEERLDDDAKIKDIKTLMAITNEFFRTNEDLRTILEAYAQAKNMGRIPKPKKVLWCYLILKDLGFISDILWEEYVKSGTGKITLSEEQKLKWKIMIGERLKDKGKLDREGQIKDLETLLSIILTFFTSDDNLRNVPAYYSKAVNIENEEGAAWHHFVLRDLGFISDKLWYEYIRFVRERSLTLIEGIAVWQELLKVILKDKGMLNSKGKIKDLDILVGITSSFFEHATPAYRYVLRTIYRVYMQELQSGGLKKPKTAFIQHYILRDLGFVSDELWQEYIKSRKLPMKERKKEWKASLSKALKEQGKLNNDGMIESLDTLLSIGVEFFESDEEVNAILVSYPKLSSQYRMNKPPLVSWRHLVLKDLGFVSEKLWEEYMEHLKKRPFPSDEQRREWGPKVRQALGTRIVDEKGKIIDFESLMSIGYQFFQSDENLRPILKAYHKATRSDRIKKPATVYMHHYLLRDLGVISDKLWQEYLKKMAFPSEKKRREWRIRLEEFLEDAVPLDSEGKIVSLRQFLYAGKEFFKQRKGEAGIWDIYLSYKKALDKGLTEKPRLSSVYHFILRDLGFVSDEMGQVYLEKRVFPPEDKKQEWQTNLRQALEDKEKLNPQGKIEDLDTLLSIGYGFYWTRTGEGGIRRLYTAYCGAIKDGRIESPKNAKPCHIILKELGFISDELWNKYTEYISRPEPFPNEEQRIEWQKLLSSVLSEQDKLDEKGRIKDLYTLLSIESNFFYSKTARKELKGIYRTYKNAQKNKRIELEKGASMAYFIFKNLGFISSGLWQEYMRYVTTPQPVPSKFERQQWQDMLRPILEKGKKLDILGQIKDLETLLSIKTNFFKTEEGKDLMQTLYGRYNRVIRDGLITRPKRVLSHYLILRSLGFISDTLWGEYIKFLTAAEIIVTDEKRQAWIGLLRVILRNEKRLNDNDQIKDLDALLCIRYAFFKAGKRGISNIYSAYTKAINSGQIPTKDASSRAHFILNHLGFISKELWDEYIKYLSSAKGVISDTQREQWRETLKKILGKENKLDEKEQIKDLEKLLDINDSFFVSGKYKNTLSPIFSAYRRAFAAEHLERPPFSTRAYFILKNLKLVSDKLWAEYESYKAKVKAGASSIAKFKARLEKAVKKFDGLVSDWAKAYKKEDIAGAGFCIDGMNDLLKKHPYMPDWHTRRDKVDEFERKTNGLISTIKNILNTFRIKAGDDIDRLYKRLRWIQGDIAHLLSVLEKRATAHLRMSVRKDISPQKTVVLYFDMLNEQIGLLEEIEREFKDVEEAAMDYERNHGKFDVDVVGESVILRFRRLKDISQIKDALEKIAACLNDLIKGQGLRAEEILKQIGNIRSLSARQESSRKSNRSVKQEDRVCAAILKSA